MAKTSKAKAEKNEETVILPLLPVKDTVIFPAIYSPLFVGREPSLVAIDKALAGDKTIFLTAQKNERDDIPKPSGLHQTGCVASIVRVHKLPTGTMKILVQGIRRAKVERFIETSPFMQVEVSYVDDAPVDSETLETSRAVMHAIRDNLEKMISLGKMLSPDLLISVDDIADPGKFADLVAAKFGFEIDELQEILESSDPIERLEKISDLVLSEMEALNARRENEFPRMEFPQGRREQFLRDQLKAIRNELGENDPRAEEVQDYRRRIRNAKLPEEVLKEAEKQSRRLEGMHPEAAEASIVRTYLDYLIEVPWMVSSEDNLDLAKAKEILDRDHYGLDKVKDRILEFLGVCKLKSNMKGPILCLVGPPGVGKTSLGKSIAGSMGREFVRSSLGGVKDEAEIRGHRRTYVGAMPGKIIQGIKQAGTNNPVFILDEIDKLGADFRGDPSSALLEVLDPEQNDTFKDHYLNLSFDLSNVMFIATANVIENIPRALRDRMEVIRIAGYTPEEKLEICKTYLLPKQLEANGISSRYLKMNKKVFLSIVEQHTRESGVRDLERKVGAICRKVARKVAEGETRTITVQDKNLQEFLGPAKFRSEIEKEDIGIGCALGLAWTEYGGDVLLIEVGLMPGKGELKTTGSLGDVMKESMHTAMTYVRANADRLKIPEAVFKTTDIHVHVPDGATPKDGPSAGITIATAIISALTKTEIRKDIAMTGEITIRGRVLQVGGIKEKLLAAKRRKVATVIIPHRCAPDLEEIPDTLKEGIKIVTVKSIDEVLDLALEGGTSALVKDGRKQTEDSTPHKQEATI